MNYILFKPSSILSCDTETIVLFLILIALLLKVLDLIINRKKQLYHIPGPLPLPLVGNALLFANAHENFLPTMKNVSRSEIDYKLLKYIV